MLLERDTLLSENFKAKMKDGGKGSGRNSRKRSCSWDTAENDKKKVDNAKAVEMRNRALKSVGETQKRQRNEDEENAKPKQKMPRSGVDTTAYLHEKMCLFRIGNRKNCS